MSATPDSPSPDSPSPRDSNCPQPIALSDYVSGQLDEAAAAALMQHLNQCGKCQSSVDDISRRADSIVSALRQPPAEDVAASDRLEEMIAGAIRMDTLPRGGSETIALPPARTTPVEPIALDSFVSCLRKSRLVNQSEIDLLIEQLEPSDSRSFAKELLARRKLTRFQAKALMLGRWKGLVLGNYIVLEKLGEGGMGRVFKARHRHMARVVCIKVLNATGRKTPALLERFRREVQTVAALHHPSIVLAHDADEADGIPFLVMEFVDGNDLAKQVKSRGPMQVEQALRLSRQAALALNYAHQQGVVHRDVKPENLLLGEAGAIKVLDLGLARFDTYLTSNADATTHGQMTNSGVVMGTIDYMSPEQALNSRRADGRSDIYSLGCTLFFLLTGRVVYDGETLMERLIAHREKPIPQLSESVEAATPALQAVFARMMAKHPGERYQTMRELADDLERLQMGQEPLALAMSQRPQQPTGLPASPLGATAASTIAPPAGAQGLAAPLAQPAAPLAAPLAAAVPDPPPPAPGGSGENDFEIQLELDSERRQTPPPRPGSRNLLMWSALPIVLLLCAMTVWANRSRGPAKTSTKVNPAYVDKNREAHLRRLAAPTKTAKTKKALIIVPHDYFYEDHYTRVHEALRSRGVQTVVASSQSGHAKPKHGHIKPVPIDFELHKLKSTADYDAIVFVGGNVAEFGHKGKAEKDAKRLILDALSRPTLLAGVGQGWHVVRDVVVDKHIVCDFKAMRSVQVGFPPDDKLPSRIVNIGESKHARSLATLLIDDQLVDL